MARIKLLEYNDDVIVIIIIIMTLLLSKEFREVYVGSLPAFILELGETER